MEKFTYIDERTFKATEVECEDGLVKVSRALHEISTDSFEVVSPGPFPNETGKKFSFGIDLGETREDRDIGIHKYRITIEKL